MGFPTGYTQLCFPKFFLHILSLLGFIRNLVFLLFYFLGLSDFLETEVVWSESYAQIPERPPVSVLLIREFLPVVKFGEIPASVAGDTLKSCAVCLYEFEEEEEIRCMRNCKHIFHRNCVDRWMDHDQKTCPLCRTPFVPDGLWAASGVPDFNEEY